MESVRSVFFVNVYYDSVYVCRIGVIGSITAFQAVGADSNSVSCSIYIIKYADMVELVDTGDFNVLLVFLKKQAAEKQRVLRRKLLM